MDRAAKADVVQFLKGVFAESGVVVVVQNKGLTVAEMSDLRAKMREIGATVKVVKNRLAKIALEDTAPTAGDMFVGPVAIVFSHDAVPAAKAAKAYADGNEKFVLLGGVLGESVLDPEAVKALATMPSLDELRAKLAGVLSQPAGMFVRTLNAPGEKFARTLAAPGGQLAGALNARKAQLEAA